MNRSDYRNDSNNPSMSNMSTILAGHGGHVNNLRQPFISGTPESVLSSTHVAEVSNYSMNIGSHKINMKLPVGPSAISDDLNQSKLLGGRPRRQHVTVRDRGDSFNPASSTISPIIPASNVRNPVKLTEPRGHRKLFPDEGGERSDDGRSGVSGSSFSRDSFPYPKVDSFGICDRDPGEILSEALNVLSAYQQLENEIQRFHGTKKRKEKSDENVEQYEFTPDTFNVVNSEAANIAVHLVFCTIDMKEAEHRFRDCWPVFEKKLEGVFRRVSLDWIKQLISDHPNFFKEVRSEAVGGLLVNPGGERFIAFMRQLCRLAMFTLAKTKDELMKQHVLLPPVPCSDPEIVSRQLHVLEERIRVNAELSIEVYKRILRNDIALSNRFRCVDEAVQQLQRVNDMLWEKIVCDINNYPDWFGEVTEKELQDREIDIATKIKISNIRDHDDYNDILRDRLQNILKERSQELYTRVSLIQDVIQDYEKVWYILDMDKSDPIVLNCNNFLPHQLRNSSGVPSLNHYIKSFFQMVDSLISNEFLKSETPVELLRDYDAIGCRVNFLELMKKKVDDRMLSNQVKFGQKEIQRNKMLKLRMNSYKWNTLSGIHEDDLSQLLDMTPLRAYDMDRSSGRTPGINKFLDSSSSSSSGEHPVAIARRNAQLMIKGRAVKRTNLLQRSVSDPISKMVNKSPPSYDTTDGKTREPTKNRLSDNLDEVSQSEQSQSVDVTGTSLLQESSLTTPASVSSSVSIRMKKSVSFGDTPTTSSFSSIVAARKRRSSRFSAVSSISCETPDQKSLLEAESPLTGSRNASRLSFCNTSSSTPLVLDSYTQERLNKLLESVAPSVRRQSLSPIASSELDAETSDSTKGDTSPNSGISDMRKPDGDFNESENYGIVTEFGDHSIIEEFEGVKGIMETSYIDFSRNSDSDDL